MNTPNNAKSAASVAALKQAFMDLITEKTYLQISVTELCKKAAVHRTTFYAHFSNTHDVLAALCRDLYTSVINEILPADGDFQKLISVDTNLLILLKLKKHKHLYQAYLPEFQNAGVIQELAAHVKQIYVRQNPAIESSWEKESEYRFEFCARGTLGIMAKWLEDDCREDAHDVAALIEQMLRQIIFPPRRSCPR